MAFRRNRAEPVARDQDRRVDGPCQRFGLARDQMVGRSSSTFSRGLLEEDRDLFYHRLREDRQVRNLVVRVRDAGGAIALQILHAGRYAYHAKAVSASATRSPISPFPARELTDEQVRAAIQDFARCAVLAQEAGYDAVEIMGSEGYFINEFLAPRTNAREDGWGGTPANRRRIATEIVRAVRAAVGDALVDLVGRCRDDVRDLVRGEPPAGADAGREIVAVGHRILRSGAAEEQRHEAGRGEDDQQQEDDRQRGLGDLDRGAHDRLDRPAGTGVGRHSARCAGGDDRSRRAG